MLVAKNLSFAYDRQILENVSLELGAGETLSIMGVSGSGKSTLLHILSGFQKPQSGEVMILGNDIYRLSADKLLALRRNDIGIIFQSHYLFSGFNAQENLEVASLLSGEKIEAIHMLPGYTHNIINLSETENLVTVMYCNECFNPNRPDTYFEPVKK